MGPPDPVTQENSHNIILFDGVCNLCNSAVQFIIRRDKKNKFKFASLQSNFGQAQLLRFGLDRQRFQTMVLIDEGRAYERSDGALRIAKRLGGIWSILYVFKFIPRFVRDPLYNLIARNRYRLFGKSETCMIPSPELKARFIE